jgi:methionine-rich copper-binding protein CopC
MCRGAIRRRGMIAILALAVPLGAQTLKLTHPVVSQSEDGLPADSGVVFQPGDTVFFSFQVENYRSGLTGKVQLTGHMQAFDTNGTPVVPRDEEVIGTTLSEEDKNWKPKMRLQIPIPPIAPPGNYTIRFEATDQQSHQMASGEVAFKVAGKTVERASALAIRNVGFFRTQDDEEPLKTVTYRAGDALWMRFDITGYRYGEQNSIDVGYDVAVLAPDGKQLFAQEDAAVEKSQAFYPQPWVPGGFNLELKTGMTPGTYTLVLTAHDAVGKQMAVERAPFVIE